MNRSIGDVVGYVLLCAFLISGIIMVFMWAFPIGPIHCLFILASVAAAFDVFRDPEATRKLKIWCGLWIVFLVGDWIVAKSVVEVGEVLWGPDSRFADFYMPSLGLGVFVFILVLDDLATKDFNKKLEEGRAFS
jgi:hypothetical protein